MGEPDTKMSFNGERMWFENLHDGRYKVCNIPFNEQKFCMDDIIDIDGNVLERKTRLKVAHYDANDDNIKEMYKEMYNYLVELDIKVEGLVAGLVALAVPMTMTDAKAYELIEASPIKIEILHEQQLDIPKSED